MLVGSRLEEMAALAEALGSRSGHAVGVRQPARGLAARWVELTRDNAAQALRMRFQQKAGMDEMLADLAAELDLPEPPARLECFDISHTGGEGTVASCVVFGPDGPLKKEYRRFNITGVTPGDDYGGAAPGARAPLQTRARRRGAGAGRAAHRRRRSARSARCTRCWPSSASAT